MKLPIVRVLSVFSPRARSIGSRLSVTLSVFLPKTDCLGGEKSMKTKEHELIVLMFARLYESIGIIEETLKSRGLWTGDDPKAFSHAVHADDRKILHYVERARSDYLAFANQLGVIVGPTS